MAGLQELIGASFERVLRWVYPGALILVLLRLSRPDSFLEIVNLEDLAGPWELIVVGFVAGFAAYMLQGYVINYVISHIFQVLNWDVNVGMQVSVTATTSPSRLLKKEV